MAKPVVTSTAGGVSLAEKSFIFRNCEKVKYEFPVLMLLLMFYVPQRLNIADDIYSMLYVFDYRLGFAPGLLIGSIMSVFTDNKSQAFMSNFFSVVFILEAVLFAFVAGRILRKAGDGTKEATGFFIALFLAVPYSLAALYPRLLSLDRFMVLFTLLALIVMSKKGLKWFVPALLFMGLATYTGFAFTYMPAVALLLIYEVYNNKKSTQSILLCVFSFAIMAIFSAYFFLFDGLDNFRNIDDLIAFASGKTDLPFDGVLKEAVETLLLKTPAGFYWNSNAALKIWRGFSHEFTAIFFSLPLIIVLFSTWRNAIKASSNRFEKSVFVLCMLAPVAGFPIFVLSNNFLSGRIAVCVVQFFLLFYFLYTGNPAVTEAVRKLGEFFGKHFFLFLLLISYCAFFFLIYPTGVYWSLLQSRLL